MNSNKAIKISEALNHQFGVRATIAVCAVIANNLGFNLSRQHLMEVEGRREQKPIADNARSFYGIAETEPKKVPDLITIATGFVAAQLMLVEAAKIPDQTQGGKKNDWARAYLRTGAELAQDAFNSRMNREKQRLAGEAAKMTDLGLFAPNTEKRVEALTAQFATEKERLAKSIDDMLAQVYASMDPKKMDNEDLERLVDLAFAEVEVDQTAIVEKGLLDLVKFQAKQIEAGKFATIDDGVYALLKTFKQAPDTGTNPVPAE